VASDIRADIQSVIGSFTSREMFVNLVVLRWTHMASFSAGLVIAAILVLLIKDFQRWRRMPPGPVPLPFLGNKLALPKSRPWIQFQEWSKTYGPIFTIWIGRRPTLVISDPTVAAELLEKRSTKYSSRPRMVVLGEIYWDNASILVQPYGKPWSVRRRLLHSALSPQALRLYKPMQEAEASRLCSQLLESPTIWEKLLERYTASIVFSVAYGHRIDSLGSSVIRQRLQFMHYSASLNVPGGYLVESLPVLKHLEERYSRERKTRGRCKYVLSRQSETRHRRSGEDGRPDSSAGLVVQTAP
jgi:cytochrome P450